MHKMWPELLKEAKGQSSEQARRNRAMGSPAPAGHVTHGAVQTDPKPSSRASSLPAAVGDPDLVQLHAAVNLMCLLPGTRS